jgi:hypothetical protein
VGNFYDNLPATMPSSAVPGGLLPLPGVGDLSGQIAQGQKLFQAGQDAGNGVPGAAQALLQGASTLIQQNVPGGLAKTLLTDAVGIGAGFAMGGPVGGAVALGSAALGPLLSLLNGSQDTEGPLQTLAPTATRHNYAWVQNYLQNVLGASASGYPPGFFLLQYLAAKWPPWLTAKPAQLLASVLDGLHPSNGGPVSPVGIVWNFSAPGGAPSGYNFLRAPPTAAVYKAWLKGQGGRSPYAATIDPTLFFAWGDASGASLPGSLAGVDAGSLTTPSWVARLFGDLYAGGTDAPESIANIQASLWQQALADIPDEVHTSRSDIASRMVKYRPDPMWFDGDLYLAQVAMDSGGSNQEPVAFDLDVMNAMATLAVMGAAGASPRAMTTELLTQLYSVYNGGQGAGPSQSNISPVFRQFVDQWLNVAQGKPAFLVSKGPLDKRSPPAKDTHDAGHDPPLLVKVPQVVTIRRGLPTTVPASSWKTPALALGGTAAVGAGAWWAARRFL